jgi:hypothetical protein
MAEMVDMEKLARVWRKMEDKRDELKHAWEAADKVIEDQQKIVGTALLSAMNGIKGNKLTTAAGVIEKQQKTRVSGADWSAIYRFVADNDAWEMLHKRISSTFVEKYAETHQDAEGAPILPPGVNVFRYFEVTVKKPGAKSLPKDE